MATPAAFAVSAMAPMSRAVKTPTKLVSAFGKDAPWEASVTAVMIARAFSGVTRLGEPSAKMRPR